VGLACISVGLGGVSAVGRLCTLYIPITYGIVGRIGCFY
jgi:hypothetical protein